MDVFFECVTFERPFTINIPWHRFKLVLKKTTTLLQIICFISLNLKINKYSIMHELNQNKQLLISCTIGK